MPVDRRVQWAIGSNIEEVNDNKFIYLCKHISRQCMQRQDGWAATTVYEKSRTGMQFGDMTFSNE